MATYSDGPTASATAAGGTLALAGVTAAVGDFLALFCAADNAGTSGVSSTATGITDPAGNTWTLQRQTTASPTGAANDGTTLSVWICTVTNALSAATLTIGFAPNTAARAAALQIASPAAGCAIVLESVGAGATFTGAGRNTGNISVPLGSTMIGVSAFEGNDALTADSDTTNGSWSTALTAVANTGAAGTSQTVSVQRKTVTAGGNQNYNTSTAASRDAATNYLVLHEAVSAALAASVAEDVTARFIAPTSPPRAGTKSVRILLRVDWPDDQVTRLWLGNGAFIDGDGEVWRGAGLLTGLDELERAVNRESPSMTVTMSGVSAETAQKAWTYSKAGNLIDAEMRILLQACDDEDQPQGAARIVFTGYFANAVFDDQGGDDPVSAVSAEIVNKFTLRRTPNWAVLSDADQKARSAVLNPMASPDRFAERVSLLETKTVTWPRF